VRGTFSTLSHVWGEKILTTLKMKELQECGNDVHTHPRSFQDAITKLGLRFPWIDALYIAQGSRKDRQVESSKMSDIFKNTFS
jgi:hypothetical protein